MQFVRRPIIMAAFLAATTAADCTSTLAQDGRNERPGRGLRRGGGPDGPRLRPGERGRDRGEPAERGGARDAASKSSTSSASTANSFGTTSEAERIRTRASQMIKDHDKSGNGILEGDELDDLRMSRGADKDGDGVITRDDLIAFYTPEAASAAATTTTTSKPADGSKSTEPTTRVITNDKRKSYRFKSTKDRIDNWRFSSRDANGDGQVSMSEYSRSWNDRTASEFVRYDKNNDGMISADEAP